LCAKSRSLPGRDIPHLQLIVYLISSSWQWRHTRQMRAVVLNNDSLFLLISTVIHDGRSHVLAGDTLRPGGLHVEIQTRLASILASIFLEKERQKSIACVGWLADKVETEPQWLHGSGRIILRFSRQADWLGWTLRRRGIEFGVTRRDWIMSRLSSSSPELNDTLPSWAWLAGAELVDHPAENQSTINNKGKRQEKKEAAFSRRGIFHDLTCQAIGETSWERLRDLPIDVLNFLAEAGHHSVGAATA
jgi:hypothetical protein